jgi:hypothetical protein
VVIIASVVNAVTAAQMPNVIPKATITELS